MLINYKDEKVACVLAKDTLEIKEFPHFVHTNEIGHIRTRR